MKKTILLVSDDALLAHDLRSAMPPEEFDLVQAGNGREAIGQFEAVRAEVVLLDLDLASNDGWETASQLLELDPLVTLVLLAAPTAHYELARALQAGTVLEKRLTAPRLRQVLVGWLAEPAPHRLHRNASVLAWMRYVRPYRGLAASALACRGWGINE